MQESDRKSWNWVGDGRELVDAWLLRSRGTTINCKLALATAEEGFMIEGKKVVVEALTTEGVAILEATTTKIMALQIPGQWIEVVMVPRRLKVGR